MNEERGQLVENFQAWTSKGFLLFLLGHGFAWLKMQNNFLLGLSVKSGYKRIPRFKEWDLSQKMAITKGSKSTGKSKSSSSQHVKGENFYRDPKKLKRLKMYTHGGKAVRDKDGKILKAASFQSTEKDLDGKMGRIQADRRWFGTTHTWIDECGWSNCYDVGNTRVISQTALSHFRSSLSQKTNDPYSVVLKQNKLPMSLLMDPTKTSKPKLEEVEPFQDTFGKKSKRKRVKLEGVGDGGFEGLAAGEKLLTKRIEENAAEQHDN
jgi:nuclear GTP-binding protein